MRTENYNFTIYTYKCNSVDGNKLVTVWTLEMYTNYSLV